MGKKYYSKIDNDGEWVTNIGTNTDFTTEPLMIEITETQYFAGANANKKYGKTTKKWSYSPVEPVPELDVYGKTDRELMVIILEKLGVKIKA